MDSSTENQTEIVKCYQASMCARVEIENYDVDREFADYAPKYTVTEKDGSVKTLQQVRSGQEEAHKQSPHQWSHHKVYEQFDIRGEQATVVLFIRDEVLWKLPSDTIDKLKVVPTTLNQVCKDTWINTAGGWKLFHSHQLHAANRVKEAEYICTSEQEDFELEVMKARTLGMAYGNGVNLTRLGMW